MSDQLALTGEFILYTSEDGQTRVTLVPTLCVGMPIRLAESQGSSTVKAGLHSHAGAWEREWGVLT